MKLPRIFPAASAFTILSFAPALANAVSPQPSPQTTQAPSAAPSSVPAASAPSPPAPPQKITQYTLPPDRHKKAHNLAKIHFRFALISFVYGLVVL